VFSSSGRLPHPKGRISVAPLGLGDFSVGSPSTYRAGLICFAPPALAARKRTRIVSGEGFRLLCRLCVVRRELVRRRIVFASVVGLLAALTGARALRAQGSPENSSREIQIWTGGGHGINGSQSDTGVWNLGLRYGLILTSPHGPGFLKGQLEYAFDVVPSCRRPIRPTAGE